MPYGLEYSEVRYETDHDGNRLKATIPYTMFSALTEFWIAARRAQTAKVEASARPGQIKGSLQAAQLPSEEPPVETTARTNHASPFPHDQHWQNLVARLPIEPAAAPIPEPATLPEQAVITNEPPVIEPDTSKVKASRVFYREFMAKPPAEVMAMINSGTYFTRAWREHRGLTLADAAELYGCDKTTILWHESGKSAPKQSTLEKFAQLYDIPILQFVPKPGSDESPFAGRLRGTRAMKAPDETKAGGHAEITTKKRASPVTPTAPADTQYPHAVLEHLIAGKSPVLAWRLYRNMSLKELAEQYGGRVGNVKSMEDQTFMRPSTIDKLCGVFRCKPEQLLIPVNLAELQAAKRSPETATTANPTAPTAAPTLPSKPARERKAAPPHEHASVIQEAFMQAKTVDGGPRDMTQRDRAQADRLARMQRELSGT